MKSFLEKITDELDIQIQYSVSCPVSCASSGIAKVKESIQTMEEFKDVGKVSDGSHTFEELYFHRMVLFSMLVEMPEFNDLAWKSWLHHDGTMYNDYFIVGINTPEGQYSYHYHKDYWDYFCVNQLPLAPEWDGHKPNDVERLLSLRQLL